MAKRIQLLLRCIIPRLESGTVTQEVVVAPCEKGRHRVGQAYGITRTNSMPFSVQLHNLVNVQTICQPTLHIPILTPKMGGASGTLNHSESFEPLNF